MTQHLCFRAASLLMYRTGARVPSSSRAFPTPARQQVIPSSDFAMAPCMAPQEVELAGLISALVLSVSTVQCLRNSKGQGQEPPPQKAKAETPPQRPRQRTPPKKSQGREPPEDQGTELHPKGWLHIVQISIYAYVEYGIAPSTPKMHTGVCEKKAHLTCCVLSLPPSPRNSMLAPM